MQNPVEEMRTILIDPAPEDAGLSVAQRYVHYLQDCVMELERKGMMKEAVLFTEKADELLELDLNIRSLR